MKSIIKIYRLQLMPNNQLILEINDRKFYDFGSNTSPTSALKLQAWSPLTNYFKINVMFVSFFRRRKKPRKYLLTKSSQYPARSFEDNPRLHKSISRGSPCTLQDIDDNRKQSMAIDSYQWQSKRLRKFICDCQLTDVNQYQSTNNISD